MVGLVLLGASDDFGPGIAWAALFVSVAAYYIAVEWRKARQAQIEADLKRDMIQKGLPPDEIERVLKAPAPPRE
jgi:hypothetical protein